MTDARLQAQIAAADGYEALLVPALMNEWTGPVLDAAGVGSGDRVLDVACGTGALAREALKRVAPKGRVTGVDLLPGMVAVAARITPEIEWREGSADALPLPDGSFDAVVSQFGMMFFPDRAAAVREMLRAVKPGGRIAVAVWDRIDANPGFAKEAELFDVMAGAKAGDAIRIPYALGDAGKLATLFENAGVADVAVETRRGTARFPAVKSMVEADLRGWLPIMGVELDEALITKILAEAENVLAPHVRNDGQVVFDSSAHIVSGSRA